MKTTVLLVAVLVTAGRVSGCDPNEKIGTGIAPVFVNIPVGGTAQVVVLVECKTNGSDFNAAATLSGGGTASFNTRLLDADDASDDVLGTVGFSKFFNSAQLKRSRVGNGFFQDVTVYGAVTLSCPVAASQVVGVPAQSGEGQPDATPCSDPADLALEVDNGATTGGANHYPGNLLGNPAAAKTVPACCVLYCDEEAGQLTESGVVRQQRPCRPRPAVQGLIDTALRDTGQWLAKSPTVSGAANPSLLCLGSPSSTACAHPATIQYDSAKDPRGHNCCTMMCPGGARCPSLLLRVGTSAATTQNFGVAQAGRTITVQGPAPWVEVTGLLGADGTFLATGQGTVAGRPNVRVRLEGQLTPMGITGDYSMGVGGELPGGVPVTYNIFASRTAWDQYWTPLAQGFQRAAESIATFNEVGRTLGGVDFSASMVRIAGFFFQAQGGVLSNEREFRPAALTSIRQELEQLAGAVSRSTLGNRTEVEAKLREAAGQFGGAAATMQGIVDRSTGSGDDELLRLINSWLATVAQAGGSLQSAGMLLSGATVANVSAASFTGPTAAPDSIAVGFGRGLATSTQAATATPLPTRLAGSTVRVRDSGGTERLAPLFFVSPTQVNYLVPAGTRPGAATVTFASSDNSSSTGTLQVEAVAPGLFSANASGRGVAAAIAIRAMASGAQNVEPVAELDRGRNVFVPAPIDLGPDTEQVVLILFGTGIRGATGLPGVRLTIGGEPAPVLFAGAQGQFAGLDQLNVGPIPRSLIGRGEVSVALTVDGKAANTVTVAIR